MSEDGKSQQPQSSDAGQKEASGMPGALQQLVSNPAIVEKLASFINSMATQMSSLPPPIKRRVKALKNVQLEVTKLEADFYKEVQQLEAKYQALYQPLFDKRRDIVTGSYQPTDEECEWGTDEEEEEEEKDKAAESKATKTEENGASGSASKSEDVKGIPEFWLTAVKTTDLFAEMIKEHDEPVLQHLTDIKIVYLDNTGMDFRIEFHFSDNEYFSNRILTKTYQVACTVDDDAPFNFEGAAITGSKGCKIDWLKGKNVTVRTVKKKQKHKGRGQTRTIVKTVQQESFFNTFSLPEGASGEMDEEELQEALADDYVRAEFLRDRLVPKAVLFFTGEAMEDDEEEEFDEEGGEGTEEDEEDEDEDYDAQQDVRGSQVKNAKPPECQQQ